MFQEEAKKNKFRRRLVAVLGILPGLWFLVVTQTQFGHTLNIRCGYWFVMLIVMSFVWLFYAVFIKKILRDARFHHDYAHDLNEKRAAQITYASTIFEAIVSTIIYVLSMFGFLLTDLSCVLEPYVSSVKL